MEITITIIVVLAIGMLAAASLKDRLQQYFYHLQQKLNRQRNSQIFEGNYIEVKAFYLQEFGEVPCISYVGSLDVGRAFAFITEGYAGKVLATYQRNYYNWDQNRREFAKTIFRLENKIMIELGHEYAHILYSNRNYDYGDRMMQCFVNFKAAWKETDYEINIITLTPNGLDLKHLQVNAIDLDIDLYYNDDFKVVDALVKERLSKTNDKGIVLLHGVPGTGKTTYLRHLAGSIPKKILFVSPAVAGNLMNPEFIDLLIDNPNSVLVIEDAENIIMDRKYSANSSVSNLLNISDGLLSDCLNVQVICTFNSALHLVDSALMRKGRLIARYEFGKLDVEKARRLSDTLGLKQEIVVPMTLAEITNPGETDYLPEKVSVIGFRREVEMAEN